jgi:hypothetical protein
LTGHKKNFCSVGADSFSPDLLVPKTRFNR